MNPIEIAGGWWRFLAFTALLALARLKKISISRQNLEPCQLFNIVYALSFIVPLAVYPNYLQSSPYLRHLGSLASRAEILTGFSILFLYWSVGLVLGGVPSGLINNRGQLSAWARARFCGLIAAQITWGTVAYLMSTPHLSGGTMIFGTQVVFSSTVSVMLHYDIGVERRARFVRATRKRQRRRQEGQTSSLPGILSQSPIPAATS